MKEEKLAVIVKEGAEMPLYASDGAAGADVRAHIDEDIMLMPGDTVLVPTGLFFEIPEGYEIQVRPRSGIAFKNQVTVLNTPGTIDSDYRGELKILLINHGKEAFVIKPKMRIAQIIFAPVVRAVFVSVEAINESARADSGFGHTGVH